MIRSFEAGTCNADACAEFGINEEKFVQLYMEAVKWAAESLAASRQERFTFEHG